MFGKAGKHHRSKQLILVGRWPCTSFFNGHWLFMNYIIAMFLLAVSCMNTHRLATSRSHEFQGRICYTARNFAKLANHLPELTMVHHFKADLYHQFLKRFISFYRSHVNKVKPILQIWKKQKSKTSHSVFEHFVKEKNNESLFDWMRVSTQFTVSWKHGFSARKKCILLAHYVLARACIIVVRRFSRRGKWWV